MAMADNDFPPIRQRKSKSGWRRWKNCRARTFVALAVLIGLIFLLGMIYFWWKFDLINIEGPSVESGSGLGNLKEAQIDCNAVCAANFAAKSTEYRVILKESEAQIDSNAVCPANFAAKSTECGGNLTESEAQIDGNLLTEPTDSAELLNAIDRRFEKMSEEIINRLNVLEEKHHSLEKGLSQLNSMLDEKNQFFEKVVSQINSMWEEKHQLLEKAFLGQLNEEFSKSKIMEQEIEYGRKFEPPEPEPEPEPELAPEPVQPYQRLLSIILDYQFWIIVISVGFALRIIFDIITE